MKTAVFDLETTNLRSDIGTLIVASFGVLRDDGSCKRPETKTILDFDGKIHSQEKRLVEWTRDQIVDADILIGHNSKAFDSNFLNGVLARHGLEPLPKRIHIDTYLAARYGWKGIPQSYSMDNLADIFGLRPKDKPSKHDWREANTLDPESIRRLKKRCAEDVLVTAELWNRLKPYYFAWRGA